MDSAEGRREQPRQLPCAEVLSGAQRADAWLSVPGLDIGVLSRPHAGAPGGGDIHCVSLCGQEEMARFALVDVSGHGVKAMALAEHVRRVMSCHAELADPIEFLRQLNASLKDLGTHGYFATALMVSYRLARREMSICNAGHPRPLFYSRDRREWTLLEAPRPEGLDLGNLPLGIAGETHYHTFDVPLMTGDLVVLYTDSLPEAVSPEGEILGERGLLEEVARLDPAAIGDLPRAIFGAARRFAAGELDDDATVMLLHHHGQPGAHLPG